MSDRGQYLEPALTVLRILAKAAEAVESEGAGRPMTELGAGVKLAQQITGRDVSLIYKWLYPRVRGGRNGRIPDEDAEKLLAFARKNHIPLTADHFFRSELRAG